MMTRASTLWSCWSVLLYTGCTGKWTVVACGSDRITRQFDRRTSHGAASCHWKHAVRRLTWCDAAGITLLILYIIEDFSVFFCSENRLFNTQPNFPADCPATAWHLLYGWHVELFLYSYIYWLFCFWTIINLIAVQSVKPGFHSNAIACVACVA